MRQGFGADDSLALALARVRKSESIGHAPGNEKVIGPGVRSSALQDFVARAKALVCGVKELVLVSILDCPTMISVFTFK